MSAAEEIFRAGDLARSLAQLQADIRQRPADPKLRIFLAQLLMVLGQWDRALTQLKVLEDVDDGALLMVRTYQAAIMCERLRERVFSGERSPVIFGDPQPWLALLIEALRLLNQGHTQQASELRAEALEQAPASAGSLNGMSFEWVADADSRLGPVLEVLVDGNYFWMPFSRIKHLAMEPPSDIRDLIWLPAQISLSNGGEVAALIPARYPGSGAVDDTQIRMGRRTEWRNLENDTYVGVGQRMLTTDVSEIGLFELRDLIIRDTPAAAVWH
jgi:type VI secretion system protein ImpE